MTRKPVILRERARSDVDEAVEHYLAEAQSTVALAFIDMLEEAFRRMGEHPAAGSPRYALELNIPGLRSWVVGEFPFLVFYVEREADIDVWRVLHAARDIPAWLREPLEG
ncbi:MAG: type II toxin-antitoxin system RelE/ParE family toxin [Chloroflexi bacterium]|nr:type II toxin-antitoxin system RelE/ParE family toxin [Chloroflexota bacterium]